MNRIALAVITFVLIVGGGLVLLGDFPGNGSGSALTESVQNVEIRDGVQYVTIEARGGYSPRVSSAQAGIPTKLVVKTNGTYDCSSALVIRSVGYQKILPQTGEEVIDLGTAEVGTSIQGTCSMGMYNFVVNFT